MPPENSERSLAEDQQYFVYDLIESKGSSSLLPNEFSPSSTTAAKTCTPNRINQSHLQQYQQQEAFRQLIDSGTFGSASSEPAHLKAKGAASASGNGELSGKRVVEASTRHIVSALKAAEKATTGSNTGNTVVDTNKMRHQIYCSGSLLAAVQNAKLFVDCKHFVDMPLKRDAESVLLAWNILLEGVENGKVDPAVLNTFVQEHFEQPGGELEDYHPTDFNSEESFENITDPTYRTWAQQLHRKWPTLCRRVSEKVLSEPHRFSLIAVPKPFVVPGGRFREMYYWDSFFTIKGLLASGMFATVRGMIENMGHLIDSYGFVPNGNRVYYLNRSQPPLLTWCLHAYYLATRDTDFVGSSMRWLEKEMKFFTEHKKFHRPEWKAPLFRYHVVAQGPRPESYREDVESAEHIEDSIEKCRLWGDIAAAAESGRDFSARWFHTEGPMAGKMGSTRTSSILPVDLNSIICGNLRIFAEFYDSLGETQKAESAREQFNLMRDTIHQVFWNDEDGCWFDYDIITQKHIKIYFDTNFFPLFTGSTHDGFRGQSIVDYLTRVGVLSFPGGPPTSLITSGQQWDFPNAWAPTTWVLIQGLRANGEEKLARTIAEKWIRKNYIMWLSTGGRMFEKYNVVSGCMKNMGGGGEYEVQEGFGWTNGVILDLLRTYEKELSWDRPTDGDESDGGSEHGSTASDCECCKPIYEKYYRRQKKQPVVVPPPDTVAAAAKLNEALAKAVADAEAGIGPTEGGPIFIIPHSATVQQPTSDDTATATVEEMELERPRSAEPLLPTQDANGNSADGRAETSTILVMPSRSGSATILVHSSSTDDEGKDKDNNE